MIMVWIDHPVVAHTEKVYIEVYIHKHIHTFLHPFMIIIEN